MTKFRNEPPAARHADRLTAEAVAGQLHHCGNVLAATKAFMENQERSDIVEVLDAVLLGLAHVAVDVETHAETLSQGRRLICKKTGSDPETTSQR